ncbi:hypothetical protein [Streptomyces sp. NPDC002559]
MVILRVGALSHSAYERMQHINIAKSVGVTEAEVAALEADRGAGGRPAVCRRAVRRPEGHRHLR